jgi:hypothetical protein
MGKSAAANWAGRWARGGRPDPLLGNSVPDRANHPNRVINTSSNQQEIDNMVSKIREDRISKAAPGSPESRGRWTDNSGLH